MDKSERRSKGSWTKGSEGSKDLLVSSKDRTQCGHVLKRMLENNLYADDEQENGSNDEVHDTDDDFRTILNPSSGRKRSPGKVSVGRDGLKIENLGQDTCKTVATDEASNVKRTMTDGVNTVEFQEVERMNVSWEVKMDGTRSKDVQQTLTYTSKLTSHQEVKNTKAAPVDTKWIDTNPLSRRSQCT